MVCRNGQVYFGKPSVQGGPELQGRAGKEARSDDNRMKITYFLYEKGYFTNIG